MGFLKLQTHIEYDRDDAFSCEDWKNTHTWYCIQTIAIWTCVTVTHKLPYLDIHKMNWMNFSAHLWHVEIASNKIENFQRANDDDIDCIFLSLMTSIAFTCNRYLQKNLLIFFGIRMMKIHSLFIRNDDSSAFFTNRKDIGTPNKYKKSNRRLIHLWWNTAYENTTRF